MSTTYTMNARLPIPAFGDSWQTLLDTFRTFVDGLASAGNLCVAKSASGGLNVRVAAGWFLDSTGAEVTTSAQDTLVVTDNATTYVWLTEAGVATLGSAWPGSTRFVLKLASVVAASGVVTSIVDRRQAWRLAGRAVAAVAISANYSVTDDDYLVVADTTAGNVSILLPPPVGRAGHQVQVFRASAGANTLTMTTAAGNINGSSTATIASQYGSKTFTSDGTNWLVTGVI